MIRFSRIVRWHAPLHVGASETPMTPTPTTPPPAPLVLLAEDDDEMRYLMARPCGATATTCSRPPTARRSPPR